MPTRFFSSVKGHIVSRYGTATKGTSAQRIGVTRKETSPKGAIAGEVELEWTDEIVAISAAEAATYATEYDRHVADGALKERTAEEWLAQVEASEKAAQAAKVDETAKTDPVPAAPESDT